MTVTVEQLRQWCRDYDAWHFQYRESRWEGWNVLWYIEQRLAGRGPNVIAWPDDALCEPEPPEDWGSKAECARVREK